ncbi:hypothetical protein [Kitasatospora sp. NPDC057541]|uniref:hypothetical protein n=1 Tax=unclassified Kitasatospora TaxID=2633591 RepID=UPI0036BA5E79
MGVDVEWHSKAHEQWDWELSRSTLLAEFGDTDHVLSDLISALDPAAYPVLGAVDPYGDTCLDGAGAREALSEVGKLKALQPLGSVPPLDALEEILRSCIGRPGTVVAFIGD